MPALPLCKVNVAYRNQSHLLLLSIACTTKEGCVNCMLYLNMPSILVSASLASHYAHIHNYVSVWPMKRNDIANVDVILT